MTSKWYLDGLELKPEQMEDEVIDAALEARKHEKMLHDLRKRDRAFNRTCASCLRRKPLDQFFHGKQGEVCLECDKNGR